MAVQIITDSTCDITHAQAERMAIEIVPLKVIFGEDAYREGVDIDMEAFYGRLTGDKVQPTTSQPSPDDFLSAFARAKEAGDSVVVLLIASKLSGTLQSATIAKDMCGYADIHIVDTLTTITGLRLLVEYACRMRDEGQSALRIVQTIEEAKGRVRLYAVVDTLEYLWRGGRLSRTAAVVGSLLSLKPILSLRDGKLSVLSKARGLNAAYGKIVEVLRGERGVDPSCPVYFGYTMTDEKCVALQGRVHKELGYRGDAVPVGCVVGAHAGPGACVVTYLVRA